MHPSPNILPHMGQDLSFTWLFLTTWRNQAFFPPEMQSYPSPHGEGVMLASSKCIFPQLLPKMQRYPFPQILSHIYMLGRILPSSKCKNPHKSFPIQILFYIDLCFMLFLFIYYISFFLIIISFDFFFSQNLELFPKVEKLFPSVWGE